MQRERWEEILQEVDLGSIDKLNSNITWYSHFKLTASVYLAISLGCNVSGRFGTPSTEGRKNASYFKHLICVALPQNRVPLSLVLLESKEYFPEILWMTFGKAIQFPF